MDIFYLQGPIMGAKAYAVFSLEGMYLWSRGGHTAEKMA